MIYMSGININLYHVLISAQYISSMYTGPRIHDYQSSCNKFIVNILDN